jgi:hypothetical protein
MNTEPAMPSTRLSGGAIAGIAVAAVAIVLLIAIVAFLIYRRRKRKTADLPPELPSESADGLLPPAPPAQETNPPPPMATVTQESSPMGLQEMRDPETVKSPPEHEVHNRLEKETVMSALEPSPLQTLMIHGRYPNR